MITANHAMKKHVVVFRMVSSVPSIVDGDKRVPTSFVDANARVINAKRQVVHASLPNVSAIQIYARHAGHAVTLRNLQLPHNIAVMTISA